MVKEGVKSWELEEVGMDVSAADCEKLPLEETSWLLVVASVGVVEPLSVITLLSDPDAEGVVGWLGLPTWDAEEEELAVANWLPDCVVLTEGSCVGVGLPEKLGVCAELRVAVGLWLAVRDGVKP